MKPRPILNNVISIEDFRAYYWLKSELIIFCRTMSINSSGGKQQISARIEEFLKTGHTKNSIPPRVTLQQMPDYLSLETVVHPGFKLNAKLREFFVKELGPYFHFNQTMRDFFKHQIGKTLQDAVNAWREEQIQPQKKSKIDSQFEYNQHIRDYFATNPDCNLADAITAWNDKKKKCRKP